MQIFVRLKATKKEDYQKIRGLRAELGSFNLSCRIGIGLLPVLNVACSCKINIVSKNKPVLGDAFSATRTLCSGSSGDSGGVTKRVVVAVIMAASTDPAAVVCAALVGP